jgi:DNA-binding MarR family transcriptional regulator
VSRVSANFSCARFVTSPVLDETFGHQRSADIIMVMPDPRTLIESESAMNRRVEGLEIDFTAAQTISSIYRAANAVRAYITNAVLRQYDLSWSGFVVMWVVWIWEVMETRHVAESAAISKATLTGVVKTLESRGWMTRETMVTDRRLVSLRLTQSGIDLMTELYPKFNAVESTVVQQLSSRSQARLTRDLRNIVRTVETNEEADDALRA